jgi:hypothetical protein
MTAVLLGNDVINRIGAFAAFWYDFIVGDDWRVAAGVVGALAITMVVSRTTDLPVWWIGVLTVAALLPLSSYRAVRRRPPTQPVSPSSM